LSALAFALGPGVVLVGAAAADAAGGALRVQVVAPPCAELLLEPVSFAQPTTAKAEVSNTAVSTVTRCIRGTAPPDDHLNLRRSGVAGTLLVGTPA
jgi:hypothetical protein